jgi:cell division protein FtsZ
MQFNNTEFVGDNPTVIKVVGVGGGGCNAIDRMVEDGICGVDFVAVNTDAQTLRHSYATTRVHIGSQLTRGLGSGGNPLIGQQSAEENQEDVGSVLKGADMVFVAAGMGGGTGTGAAPVIAQAARDSGALTIAAVTRPFAFEGRYRQKVAEYGITQLRAAVDTLIVIPNDRLLEAVSRETPINQAFSLVDSVLRQGIQGISDIVVQRGLINVDFNDVRAIMGNAGTALMAMGHGTGPNRVVEAVQKALGSPMLEFGVEGAKSVLFNVSGSEDLGILEVYEAAEQIASAVDPEANIIFGAVIDEHMPAGQVKITLVATGFDSTQPASQRKRLYLNGTSAPQAITQTTVQAAQVAPMRSVPTSASVLPPRQAVVVQPTPVTQAMPVAPVPTLAVPAQSTPNKPLIKRISGRLSTEQLNQPESERQRVTSGYGEDLDIPPFLRVRRQA